MKDHKITHYNFLPNEKPKKEDFKADLEKIQTNRVEAYQKALDFYNLRENGPEIPWKSFKDELPEVGKEIKRYDGDDCKVHDFIFRYRYSRDDRDKWIDFDQYNALQFEWEKVRYLGDENELYKGWEYTKFSDYVKVQKGDNRIDFPEIGRITGLVEGFYFETHVFHRSELQLILNNRMK